MLTEKSRAWVMLTSQLGNLLSRLPLPPNFYTWLTIIPAILGFFAMTKYKIGLATFLFLLSGLLDSIDGVVARRQNKTSEFGAFLDGSLDRFVDALFIFSYFWLPLQLPLLSLGQWLFLAIFFVVMPSFEVAYANHRKAVNDPNEKLIWRIFNRDEMFIVMLIIPPLSIWSGFYAGILLLMLILLSFITTIQTIYLTYKLSN